MTEYCDWSDMPVPDCQHCKDGKKSVVVVESEPVTPDSRVFLAKYETTCPKCRETVEIEEEAVYGSDERVYHAVCLPLRQWPVTP